MSDRVGTGMKLRDEACLHTEEDIRNLPSPHNLRSSHTGPGPEDFGLSRLLILSSHSQSRVPGRLQPLRALPLTFCLQNQSDRFEIPRDHSFRSVLALSSDTIASIIACWQLWSRSGVGIPFLYAFYHICTPVSVANTRLAIPEPTLYPFLDPDLVQQIHNDYVRSEALFVMSQKT